MYGQLEETLAEGMERLVTFEVAHHVLRGFDEKRAMEPGTFVKGLIVTIASADPMNKAKLARGFPEYVAAVTLAQGRSDGMDRLRRIARISD